MKNIIIGLITLVIVTLFVGSCNDVVVVSPLGLPQIYKIDIDTASIGDTITISGINFISDDTRYRIYIDSTAYINREECLTWQNNKIIFIIPDSANSGLVKVKRGDTFSDGIMLKIGKLPSIDVVEIPAGKFKMGSETGFSNELPVREVTISQAFYMTKFEISQRIFEIVMGYNPSTYKNLAYPVDSVDWLTAVTFCNNLSKMSGFDTCYRISGSGVIFYENANGWRLPTEAEWEYAARDTTKGDYGGNGFMELMGWFNENSGMKAHPSGFKKPNLYGLYDMHGNLWEHCWDWYQFDYYNSTDNTQIPKGPASGERRIMRGGSWSAGKGYARSSNRNIPEVETYNIGIRLVRTKF